MKNKLFSSLAISSFLLTGVSFAQNATDTPPASAPVAVADDKPVAHHEKHEHHGDAIHKALRKLRSAKEELEKSSREYGGHKAKAIEHIEAAIAELKEAGDKDKD